MIVHLNWKKKKKFLNKVQMNYIENHMMTFFISVLNIIIIQLSSFSLSFPLKGNGWYVFPYRTISCSIFMKLFKNGNYIRSKVLYTIISIAITFIFTLFSSYKNTSKWFFFSLYSRKNLKDYFCFCWLILYVMYADEFIYHL